MNRLPKPLRRTAAVLLAVSAIAAAACGGGSADQRARDLYRSYRSAEDQRTAVEAELSQAFVDIAAAADTRRRTQSLAAVDRGREAAREIERLLGLELKAAVGLAAFENVAADAGRLREGIETTRASLRLFAQELDVAARDPFLTQRADVRQIRDLSRRAARLAVTGELRIRRADRAIALALGLEPRLDPGLEAGTTTAP
jgi:hypothetical protein